MIRAKLKNNDVHYYKVILNSDCGDNTKTAVIPIMTIVKTVIMVVLNLTIIRSNDYDSDDDNYYNKDYNYNRDDGDSILVKVI